MGQGNASHASPWAPLTPCTHLCLGRVAHAGDHLLSHPESRLALLLVGLAPCRGGCQSRSGDSPCLHVTLCPHPWAPFQTKTIPPAPLSSTKQSSGQSRFWLKGLLVATWVRSMRPVASDTCPWRRCHCGVTWGLSSPVSSPSYPAILAFPIPTCSRASVVSPGHAQPHVSPGAIAVSPAHVPLRVAFLRVTRVSLSHVQPHVFLGAIVVSPDCAQPHVPPRATMGSPGCAQPHVFPGATMVSPHVAQHCSLAMPTLESLWDP